MAMLAHRRVRENIFESHVFRNHRGQAKIQNLDLYRDGGIYMPPGVS